MKTRTKAHYRVAMNLGQSLRAANRVTLHKRRERLQLLILLELVHLLTSEHLLTVYQKDIHTKKKLDFVY